MSERGRSGLVAHLSGKGKDKVTGGKQSLRDRQVPDLSRCAK